MGAKSGQVMLTGPALVEAASYVGIVSSSSLWARRLKDRCYRVLDLVGEVETYESYRSHERSLSVEQIDIGTLLRKRYAALGTWLPHKEVPR